MKLGEASSPPDLPEPHASALPGPSGSGLGAGTALIGTVEREIFRSSRGDFAVLRLQEDPPPAPAPLNRFTAVGTFPPLRPGERVYVRGEFVEDPRHGRQLKVSECIPLVPETLTAFQRFLEGGAVEGIGPVLAARLIESCGEQLFPLLEGAIRGSLDALNALGAVPGVGVARAQRLVDCWQTLQIERGGRLFLAGLEVPTGLAERIQRRYGEQTEAIIRQNPYLLAEDIRGIGFVRADALASRLGVSPDAPGRARAAVHFLLQKAVEEGHVYLPQSRLLEQGEALGLTPANLLRALNALQSEQTLVLEPEIPSDPPDMAIYPFTLWEAECQVAAQLVQLDQPPQQATNMGFPVARWVETLETVYGIQLAPAQKEAAFAALESSLVIISGGPGTGKTTLVRILLGLYDRAGLRVLLAAPTGRAARRLQEASGQEACTLHRLLEVQPPGMRFQRNRANPVEADVVLVDEASMIDLPLFAALLDALPPTCRLVLVGDAQQLPPVGPGNVLESLLNSGVGHAVILSQVHRQGQASLIALNARRMQHGLLPQLPRGEEAPDADFFFLDAPDPELALARVVELVKHRLPARYGFNALRDIQVLTPSHKGALGVASLNKALQDALNPPPSAHDRGQRLRVGDKVLQARNNYDLDLFNGDLGFIVALSSEGLTLACEGRELTLEPSAQEDLELAYAMTVHKAQGSEFPAVVIPVMDAHTVMLRRNLLYTAVTRARKLVVLVGSWEAVSRAVTRDIREHRYSALQRRLAPGSIGPKNG